LTGLISYCQTIKPCKNNNVHRTFYAFKGKRVRFCTTGRN
jgi:hypothetical protein